MAKVVNMASNVHPRTHRASDLEPDPPEKTQTAALAAFMTEVGRELGADGVFGWLDQGGSDQTWLFGLGTNDARGSAFRAAAVQAILPAAAGGTPSVPEWTTLDARSGGGTVMTLREPVPQGCLLLGCWFAPGMRLHQRRTRRRAIGLAPAVGACVRLWSGVQAGRNDPSMLAATLDSLQHGVVLIDGDAHVRFVNAAARAMIARRDGVHLHGRMLCANRVDDTARLQTALSHAVMRHASGEKLADPVMTIARKAGRPLIATVVAHEDRQAPANWLTASVFLFDPEDDLESHIGPICRFYGLSPVEAKLACLLTSGACLTTAADTLNVREQTARSYLKQIFAKTGTNRQAQLVSVMLKSAVRTAGGRYAPLL